MYSSLKQPSAKISEQSLTSLCVAARERFAVAGIVNPCLEEQLTPPTSKK
jgi:hypothetical protein